MTKKFGLIVCGLLGAAQSAYAQDATAPVDVDVNVYPEEPGMYSYGWNDPRLMSGIGIGFTIGGGINGFADDQVRAVTDSDVGGAWAARMTLGTHTPLGLDVQYTGSTVDLRRSDFAGATQTPSLLTTNVEGALRWNILPHYMVNPYVFGGAGWQRIDIRDTPATADINDSDDLASFPVGVGVGWRDTSGLVLDARGTYRWTTDSNLLATNANFDNWEASANLGYEF
jgi:hypothetical protein